MRNTAASACSTEAVVSGCGLKEVEQLTAYDTQEIREHSLVLGENFWCYQNIERMRRLIVHVEEVQRSGKM
jgi:hypothetical protein